MAQHPNDNESVGDWLRELPPGTQIKVIRPPFPPPTLSFPDQPRSQSVPVANSPTQTNTALTKEWFKKRAVQQLVKISAALTVSTLVLGFCFSMESWSEKLQGWQARLITNAFHLLGTVALLGVVAFAVALWMWCSGYSSAKARLNEFPLRPDLYKQLHRAVVGSK